MLQVDIVKDDSGAYAVFTEQSSFASQMTAAKIMDVIARLPCCDGQAADAVSAYTNNIGGRFPDCSKFPNRNVQMFEYVFHDSNGQNHLRKLKIPWYLLNETCTVIHKPAELGMCVRSSETWVISVSICGWHQNGWRDAEYGPHVEKDVEKCGH